VDSPLHIGLAGSDPDIADKDIAHLNGIVPTDCHLVGCAGLHWREPDLPPPDWISSSLPVLAAKRDSHRLAGRGRPKDSNRRVALDEHMIADECGQAYIGVAARKRK
jgi:hypothetical protein